MNKLNAEYGIVMRLPESVFGYFGWPSVIRLPNGRLYAAASGGRYAHVCPFGKSLAAESEDEGKTWTPPMIVNDTPLDDRDTGLTALPDGRIAITWFTNTVEFQRNHAKRDNNALSLAYTDLVTAEGEAENLGSLIRYSSDCGRTWGEKVKVPVTAPHGFTVLKDGTLFYFGKEFEGRYGGDADKLEICAYTGTDGLHWKKRGSVPLPEGFIYNQFHEPHSIELNDGSILGMIRVENHSGYPFNIFSTYSRDKGRTWTTPEPTSFEGSPPHLLRHSSGAIVCTYAERKSPNACIKAAISRDEGKTWEDFVLDDRSAKSNDLGYPCSVELKNGKLLTIYYQKYGTDKQNSILSSEWEIPD